MLLGVLLASLLWTTRALRVLRRDAVRLARCRASPGPRLAPVILINSHAANDAADLIASLRAQNVPAADILLAVGGSASERVFHATSHIQVDAVQNSFDFTALIALLEHRAAIEGARGSALQAVFYMHDTALAGPTFVARLAPLFAKRTARLVSRAWAPLVHSMNHGVYDVDDLERLRCDIFRFRSFPATAAERARVKITGFAREDFVFAALGIDESLTLFASLRVVADDAAPQQKARKVLLLRFPELDLGKKSAHNVFFPDRLVRPLYGAARRLYGAARCLC